MQVSHWHCSVVMRMQDFWFNFQHANVFQLLYSPKLSIVLVNCARYYKSKPLTENNESDL